MEKDTQVSVNKQSAEEKQTNSPIEEEKTESKQIEPQPKTVRVFRISDPLLCRHLSSSFHYRSSRRPKQSSATNSWKPVLADLKTAVLLMDSIL